MTDKVDNELFKKYMKAGEIAASVREESKKWIKPGTKLLEIADKIESLIKKKAAIAFPVNLSLNEIAAHYTPIKNDETVFTKDDILKIDIGVHVDGYVGDTAYTVSFNKEYNSLVRASASALEEAIKIIRPGLSLSAVGETIEETIKSAGFQPVRNLSGHGLEQYNIHAEPQVPNVSVFSAKSNEYVLAENEVIAIEPFATNGSGLVKESEPAMIFSCASGPARNPDARTIMSFAAKLQGLPFAERWLPIDSRVKIRLALRELESRGLAYSYAPLKEVDGGMVSQAEHTVIVKEKPIITTEIKESVKRSKKTGTKISS